MATTATSSTRFTLIPANSDATGHDTPPQAFSAIQGNILIAVAALLALTAWIWTIWLLAKSDVHNAYYIAGHVMAGISCICTSLVALVATIVRQIRNSYSHPERKWWPAVVLAMGTLGILWGLLVTTEHNPAKSSIGYIMIGLGLVCYSISSKVILLAAIWRNTFKLANRIPLIPVFTGLGLPVPLRFPLRDGGHARGLLRTRARTGRLGRHLFHAILHSQHTGKRYLKRVTAYPVISTSVKMSTLSA